MYINFFLIPFIIIIGLFFSAYDSKRSRRNYIILSFLVLIFVAATRSPEWMTHKYHIDTLVYENFFESTVDMEWPDIWKDVVARYYLGESESDIGYVALNKLISYVTDEFYVFSILADLIFFVPFGIILYRYTTHTAQIIFALVYYVTLVQVFILGGGRQIFAVGFDLIALLYILDGKKWKSIFFFLLGLTMHFSSFLFLIPLLLIWLKTGPRVLKTMHVVCFLLFPLVLAMPNEIIVFMGDLTGVEKYTAYGEREIQGGADTFIFLMETLSFFCLITISIRNLASNRDIRSFYVMAPLFTIFTPLIHSNGSMIRITLYYSLFLTLLVPYAIDCGFPKYKNYFYFIFIFLLSFMALSGGGTQYYFFWQQIPV